MIPPFLSELVRTIIVMTISGGLLALLLLLVKPAMRHRLPKSAQYLMWLVVLASFLIPISRIAALPVVVADIAPIHNAVERNIISTAEARDRLPVTDMSINANAPSVTETSIVSAPTLVFDEALPIEEPVLITRAVTVFMVIYPLMFAIVLLYSLAGYAIFTKRLRRSYISPYPHELHVLGQLTKGKRAPRLIISSYAATPMLIGIFRPIIVLPNREYTPEQLQSIFLHELTHMRRFDVAIKWLSLLACAAHWFNPLIWVTRREIDRICELSCDEAVIRSMDKHGKQNYGETLISLASAKKIPLPVLSTTMCAEKRAIKEGLTAIMKNRKHTKLAILISALLIFSAILVACASGAATARVNDDSDITQYSSDSYTTNDAAVPLSRTIEDYAHDYIQSLLPDLNVFREDDGSFTPATIIDTRINNLEKVAEFSHIIPQTIELWRLDFMLQTEDIEDGNVRWGTFAPDEDGWLGQHMGWNDANILLVFIRNESGVEYLWHIPWAFELHTNTQTLWGLETALRMVLEVRGYIPAMIFPGNHYIVYFDMGREYGRIFLSQPFEQGADGIWIAERWQQIGNESDLQRDYHEFITHYALPYDSEFNQTFLEHAENLQRLFDAGQAPWLASPYESAKEYMSHQGLGDIIMGIYYVSAGINIPTSIPPHIFQDDTPGEPGTDYTGNASDWPPTLSYPLPTDIERYIQFALTMLQPGTARTHIERYLGTPYLETQANESTFARHHILVDPAYTTPTYELDDADREALQDGRIRLVAFVMYSIPDILTSFTIFYSTQEGAVYELRYMGDIVGDISYSNFDGYFSHLRIMEPLPQS